jgi:hypothetical protein
VGTVACLEDKISAAAQKLSDQFANIIIVVNHKDGFHSFDK